MKEVVRLELQLSCLEKGSKSSFKLLQPGAKDEVITTEETICFDLLPEQTTQKSFLVVVERVKGGPKRMADLIIHYAEQSLYIPIKLQVQTANTGR